MSRKKEAESGKFEGFFKLRKKAPKSGAPIKSKKDKARERRVKPKDLIRDSGD
ncbi:MAG: hypothetical protein ACT4NX_05770 [Deltaproteobacteria bacterium]